MNERIKELVEEAKKFSEDSKRNNELAKLLRQQKPSVKFDVLLNLLDSPRNSYLAIKIAKRVLNEKEYVRRFFWRGLDLADSHFIQFWLEFALPKLGVNSVIRILIKKGAERPRIISDSLYFLPSLVTKKDYPLIDKLKEHKNTQ